MIDWRSESPKKLAEWWCSFNRFEYPEDFPFSEPQFFNKDREMTRWIIDGIMFYIGNKIGLKECLRQWNIDTMPGKKFDEWWEKRGEREE